MSRFPNSMERMAEEGSRRGAQIRARVQQAYEEWLDWAMQGLPEGANLSLGEAYFAGWYARHRGPVDEVIAADAKPAGREIELEEENRKLHSDLLLANRKAEIALDEYEKLRKATPAGQEDQPQGPAPEAKGEEGSGRVQIGAFEVRPAATAGHIGIWRNDGEGGEFKTTDFEAAIKEFYDANF